jgi:hypothetical protein
MSLSAKFAQLKKVAPTNDKATKGRVQQSIVSQQNKRAAQNQARRTGAPVLSNGNRGSNKPAQRNGGGKLALNGVKKNIRNNGKTIKPVKISLVNLCS